MSGFRAEAVRLGADYESVREPARRELARAKEPRRVQLGERLALVFENGESLRAAAEEGLRSERITDAGAAQPQLEAFQSLSPPAGTLAAVLFIDCDDPALLAETAASLRGVQESVTLVIDGEAIRGEPTPADADSGAYRLLFAIGEAGRQRLADAAEVKLRVDHPGCAVLTRLHIEQRRALLEDL